MVVGDAFKVAGFFHDITTISWGFKKKSGDKTPVYFRSRFCSLVLKGDGKSPHLSCEGNEEETLHQQHPARPILLDGWK